MKIKEVINNAKIDKKTARILLSDILHKTTSEIILKEEEKLKQKEYYQYKRLENRIAKGNPIQYVLKKTNFLGNDFYINKNVLIPRPETESLTKKTNELIKKYFKNENIKVLEIGTGSGVIAITLKKQNNNYEVTATDISKKALKVAKKNQKNQQVDIKLINTDIAKNIKNKYDVLISNPPYIPKNSKTVEEQVIKHEPHLALFAEENGLYFYKRILKETKNNLNETNIIAFEIGENQAEEIKQMAEKTYENPEIIIEKDANNFERYIFIINKWIKK